MGETSESEKSVSVSENSDYADTNIEMNEKIDLPKQYYLEADLEEKIQNEYPEVVELLKSLYRFINKQNQKLKRLKQRLKMCPKIDSATQTDFLEESFLKTPQSIIEEITQAAELAVQNTGFVFEETSGLYYDYNTGYYYNAELGLYYDGNTGTYMSYDPTTQSYTVHSRVHIASSPKEVNKEIMKGVKTKMKRKIPTPEKQETKKKCLEGEEESEVELEEGECSDSSSSITSEKSTSSVDNDDSLDSDIAKPWPPCMRIIIEETSIPKLKKGSLYVITFEGGTLGREGDHSIVLSDINVSKHHLKFTFDKDSSQFKVTDLGSRNGTLLNGKRMSASKQESEAMEVVHGSRIQIGSTVLLCHIHNGNETCGLCEPGLIQNNEDEKRDSVMKTSKELQHKKELQRLRKKFGITFQDNASSQLAAGYSDRAQARRETIGSHNEHEKTEVASIDESIKSDNIGFKLLSKMGWSEGQSLGKEGTGISEPVQLVSNVNAAGLGSTTTSFALPKGEESTRESIWKKTQQRFQQLSPSRSIFNDDSN